MSGEQLPGPGALIENDPISQGRHSRCRGAKADTHHHALRPPEGRQQTEGSGGAGATVPWGSVAGSSMLPPQGAPAAVTGTCAPEADRQGSVNPSAVTYQRWDHAFVSLIFPSYKF